MYAILRDNWLLFLVGSYPHGPLGGIAATLLLSAIGIGAGFPASVLLALAQLSPLRAVRLPALWLRYALRSVPLVMLVFGAYFLAPLLIGRAVGSFATMAGTLTVFEAVYFAEIVRAGIQALSTGQMEAASALGMGYATTMRRIVLPQALENALPSIVGQFVTTIKDTSLGYVIGVQEVTYVANQVNNNLLVKPFQVFFDLSLLYFAICFALTQAARHLERRRVRRRGAPGAGAARRPTPAMASDQP